MGLIHKMNIKVTDSGNIFMSKSYIRKSKMSKKEEDTKESSLNPIGEITPKKGRRRFSEREIEGLYDLVRDNIGNKVNIGEWVSFVVRNDKLEKIYKDALQYQIKVY